MSRTSIFKFCGKKITLIFLNDEHCIFISYVHFIKKMDIESQLDDAFLYAVFFSSNDIVSKGIRLFECTFMKTHRFSHVGILVHSRHLLKCECVTKKGFLVLESTMSGNLNDGVKNICNNNFFGVQLREFSDIINTKIYNITVVKLPYEISKNFDRIIKKFLGIGYDYNFINLLAIHVPLLQVKTKRMFCSEMAACLLKFLFLIPLSTKPKKTSPNKLFELLKDKKDIINIVTSHSNIL
jgi:hypothetical protein